MKKMYCAIMVLATLMTTFIFSAKAQQKATQYAVKSGHVEYQLTGNTSGTKSIWWDNYGEYSYIEVKSKSTTRILGMTQTNSTHTVTIIKNGKYWTIDLNKNSGQKGTIPYYDASRKIVGELTPAEQKQLAKDILEQLGGEYLESQNFSGYNCDIISLMGAKIWIYNGIPLKTEAKMMGITNFENATTIKLGINVPQQKFMPLPNISYQDIDQQRASMYGSMNDMNNDENTPELELEPVKYPYSLFSKKINAFSYKNYHKIMLQKAQGQYMATFMKGMNDAISISAISAQNPDNQELSKSQKIKHQGRICYFQNSTEDNSSILMIKIDEYDTFIVVAITPVQNKLNILTIADALDF